MIPHSSMTALESFTLAPISISPLHPSRNHNDLLGQVPTRFFLETAIKAQGRREDCCCGWIVDLGVSYCHCEPSQCDLSSEGTEIKMKANDSSVLVGQHEVSE